MPMGKAPRVRRRTMTEMKEKDKDDNCWPLWSRSSVEVGVANTTTNHRGEHCRRVGGGLQKEQRAMKRGSIMPTRRTSEEEEEDCATTATATDTATATETDTATNTAAAAAAALVAKEVANLSS